MSEAPRRRSWPAVRVRYSASVQRLPSLRASDADREQAAAHLRQATAEGRLSAEELEERLDALFAAKTYGELDALVADLPVTHSPSRPPAGVARWASAAAAVTLLLTVLGMLAVARERSAELVGPRIRQFRTAPFVDPHHALVLMAARVGVFAVLLACAALAWAFMRSRSSSHL